MNKAKTMVLLAICMALVGCSWFNTITPEPDVTSPQQTETDGPSPSQTELEATPVPTEQPTQEPTPEPTPTPEPLEISIMAVGDIMFHGSQITNAYDSKTKTYNFEYSYQFIRDIISSADLAMGNFECTLGGPNKQYSQPSSMSFNAPDSGADALKWAGFDILSTANNHSNDRGRDGLIRTVTVMREKGIECVGTRKDTSEKPYHITDVKGIKIGVTGYTFGSRNSDLLNVYSSNTTKELQKMEKIVNTMREEGAEIVVFIIHWGSEYQRKPGSAQKKMAQGLADIGVDVIFGSHAHVLQPVDIIQSEKSGKKTFVAYSLGNFISNQITKWNSSLFQYTEDSMILRVNIVKQPDGSPAAVSTVEYLPTKTTLYMDGNKRRYTVLPLEQALKSPEDFDLKSSYDKKKAQKSLDDTNKLLSDAVEKEHLSLLRFDE